MDLAQEYNGLLKVVIYGFEDVVDNATFDYRESITGKLTLFDYVGQACASIFTNMTTRLSIVTRSEDWQIINFDPENHQLEVRQIDGDPLPHEEDDLDSLFQQYGNFFN